MELAGHKNAYTCEKCQGQIVTVNLLDGVTPFMIKCRARWPTPCGGMAKSAFYRIDQSRPAEWGWCRPDAAELDRIDVLNPGMREHVAAGGLLLRKLDNAERETYGGEPVRQG